MDLNLDCWKASLGVSLAHSLLGRFDRMSRSRDLLKSPIVSFEQDDVQAVLYCFYDSVLRNFCQVKMNLLKNAKESFFVKDFEELSPCSGEAINGQGDAVPIDKVPSILTTEQAELAIIFPTF
ncbi:hypothetical protein TNCV_5072591 [Trichonephila clavipes]|nr:hypothetical protein TNCV_5072591 [Trichonephila clavipes]